MGRNLLIRNFLKCASGGVLPFAVSATLLLLPKPECHAQKVYQFVEIPSSARAAALGGVPLAIAEPDLGLAAINPAYLPQVESSGLVADYTNYISDISLGHVTYNFTSQYVPGAMAVGLQYLNGGSNKRYDSEGNASGEFSSNEFALNLSYARKFDSCLAIGATVKPVLSYVGGYSSVGILVDVAASYTFAGGHTSASLILRNAGAQLTAYYDDYGDVPFEIDAALSHQLEHAPFRVSLVLQKLQKFDLTVGHKNSPEPGSEIEDSGGTIPDFADKLLRHCVIGLELFPQKTFNLRAGFNYQRRQELKLKESSGLAGVSLGFGLRLKKFSIEYAHARYAQAGASNHFSLTVNLPQ